MAIEEQEERTVGLEELAMIKARGKGEGSTYGILLLK